MKRLSTMAALLFTMLAAITAFSPSAKAQTITCNTHVTNSSGWPYTTAVSKCSNTDANNFALLQDGLSAAVTTYTVSVNGKEVGKGPVLKGLNPIVYFFHDANDYTTFFAGTNCPLLSTSVGVYAVSFFDPDCSVTKNQSFTAVFEDGLIDNDNTGNQNLIPNNHISNSGAHEMGHWYDYQVLGSAKAPFSGTGLFPDEQTKTGGDIPTFNGLGAPCSGTNHPFAGQQDVHNPVNYICASNGNGPGLNTSAPPAGAGGPYSKYTKNTDVLAEAVGNNYSSAQELFANEVAFNAGTSFQWEPVDHYMSNYWACTQTVVLSELQYGQAPGVSPSPYKLPTGCPAS